MKSQEGAGETVGALGLTPSTGWFPKYCQEQPLSTKPIGIVSEHHWVPPKKNKPKARNMRRNTRIVGSINQEVEN